LHEVLTNKIDRVPGPNSEDRTVHLRIGDVVGRKDQSLHHQTISENITSWDAYVRRLILYFYFKRLGQGGIYGRASREPSHNVPLSPESLPVFVRRLRTVV